MRLIVTHVCFLISLAACIPADTQLVPESSFENPWAGASTVVFEGLDAEEGGKLQAVGILPNNALSIDGKEHPIFRSRIVEQVSGYPSYIVGSALRKQTESGKLESSGSQYSYIAIFVNGRELGNFISFSCGGKASTLAELEVRMATCITETNYEYERKLIVRAIIAS